MNLSKMDENSKNFCPNCCQTYHLKSLKPKPRSNIPLFIKCGHSMCEFCICNILKSGEPIQCKVCQRTMEVKTDVAKLLQNKIELYNVFPVNVSMLGELALELIVIDKPEVEEKKAEDYFIDLQSILNSTEKTQGQCLECHSTTIKMCQQCATILCEACFDKSHKKFVVFKNHVLQNIGVPVTTNNCKVHCLKALEYYCKDCDKSICMDCFMVGSEKSCKNHDVVPMVEINEKFLSDLREILPQVDTKFRRLTKTAVDIGHQLLTMDNAKGSPELLKVTASIEQHFSKLQAEVQAHRNEVMKNIARLRHIERESLLRAREEVATAIKQSKKVMDALKTALSCEKNQTTNLTALLEEAKNLVDRPWCLSKEESKKDKLKVCVSEELCLLVSDYVQLVGNAQARYSLRASSQLDAVPEAPRAPVFPPTFPRDVRFNKPEAVKSPPTPSEVPYQDKAGASMRAVNGTSSQSSPEMKKVAIPTAMPYAQRKPETKLKAGVQEQANITYMQDPHHFYVRRCRDDALLNEIEKQLREFLGDVPRDVSIGNIYAVKCENSLKRGRVDKIDVDESGQPSYRVTYIDYGHTTGVGPAGLRDIPTTLAEHSGLALRCRLANCEPDGAWRPDDTALTLGMAGQMPVTVHVRRAGACNDCDVTTHAGVSVAHALRFHARAAIVNPSLPYPRLPHAATLRLQPADTTLRTTGSADVIVTHVVSPDKFYARESRLQADYLKLCEELNNAYDFRDESDLIYLPKEGSLCVALVGEEEGRRWARAQVQAASAAGAVRVWLPDTGEQRAAPWRCLRAPRPRFTALRPMAIECHLAGISPIGDRWQDSASELLAQHAGRALRLLVHESRRRSIGAVLYDPAGDVCLNRELVARQLASGNGTITFRDLPDQKDSLEKEPAPQSPINGENASYVDYETMSKSYQDDQPSSKRSLRLEAKILHYESPSLIYISLLHQQKTFNELFEDIQKFYVKRKTPRRENWKANDRCCAFCMQSQTWRRATILETEKEQVTVFFTDFAQTETVPLSNLRRLHSDFEVIGDAAIKCHLAGVLPADGEWPSLTKEFLKDKLDEYKRVFVTKVGEFEDKSMPVQLWVYHTELGSALEPNECEWRCLNGELLTRGLALPDAHQTETTVEEDDSLRFLNVRGSVQSWLLPPLPASDSSGEPAADWLPAEPLRADEFTAVPTYIDNDGVIYLHDVSQVDDLELIRDTLQLAFKEDDPKAPYCTWRVGEPCVARYYLDSQFYRATVLEVNPEQANCLVQYVDYGNTELCPFADLRKRVALHQIPVQAHKVSLAFIKPVGEQWDLTVLDYVHKAIVEKKCFVKVVAPAVGDVTPVHLKYDKLWINDHLVEFDLAAYIDGSKHIDRKFKKKSTPTSRKPERLEPVKAETKVIEINSGSEPDYVVEEEMDSSQASGSPDSFKMKTLVDKDTGASEKENSVLISYLRHEDREFNCNVPVINDTNSVELMIIRDAETRTIYEALLDIVKDMGKTMPPLNGTYECKPCIALFEDHWYRASILKYSEAKNLVKVHYVDYGNIGIVPLSDVREISKDWVCLPPACVTARLHGVRVNPDLDPDYVLTIYIDTFLDKGPFRATIVDYVDYDNSMPLVELRNSDGELVYKKLIEDKVFLLEKSDKLVSSSSEVD